MIFFQSMNPSIGLPNSFVNRQTEAETDDHQEMNTLGQRIRTRRKELGLTQKDLAAKVGMSQANLSELENDLYPSSSFVPRMAEVLKVSAMWLADGKKEPPGATLHHITTRHANPDIAEVIRLMEETDDIGRTLALGGVRAALATHHPAKKQGLAG